MANPITLPIANIALLHSGRELVRRVQTIVEFLNQGVGGIPGGSNTDLQFNDSGALGGNGSFTYDATTYKVTANVTLRVANTGRFVLPVGTNLWANI